MKEAAQIILQELYLKKSNNQKIGEIKMNLEGSLIANRYEIIEKIGRGRYGYCI